MEDLVGSGDDMEEDPGEEGPVGSGDDMEEDPGEEGPVGSGDDTEGDPGEEGLVGSDDDMEEDPGEEVIVGSDDDTEGDPGEEGLVGRMEGDQVGEHLLDGEDEFIEDGNVDVVGELPGGEGQVFDDVMVEHHEEAHQEDDRYPDDDDDGDDGDDDIGIELDEMDDYSTILKHFTKEWLQIELDHRVSKAASAAFWNLGKQWFHRLFTIKNLQRIGRKTPGFSHLRKQLYLDYVPPIRMDLGYLDKDTGNLIIVEDTQITPQKQFPRLRYQKLFEIGHVKVTQQSTLFTFVYLKKKSNIASDHKQATNKKNWLHIKGFFIF